MVIGGADLSGRMNATDRELAGHVSQLTSLVNEVCQVGAFGSGIRPSVEGDGTLVGIDPNWAPNPFRRSVTTNLGNSEVVLRLPIPTPDEPPLFWIGLHELWRRVSKYRVEFSDCGLRVYLGTRDEAAAQIMRLEWVAPLADADGQLQYPGSHAGHPHWQIDRAALVAPSDALTSLKLVGSGEPEPSALETFGAEPTLTEPVRARDYWWIQRMHFPAHAGWMEHEWDGSTLPGPHQCEPLSLNALAWWWAGALRYVCAELGKYGPRT